MSDCSHFVGLLFLREATLVKVASERVDDEEEERHYKHPQHYIDGKFAACVKSFVPSAMSVIYIIYHFCLPITI